MILVLVLKYCSGPLGVYLISINSRAHQAKILIICFHSTACIDNNTLQEVKLVPSIYWCRFIFKISISISMTDADNNPQTKWNNMKPTYRSIKDERFPISLGMLPVNSFHMKSLVIRTERGLRINRSGLARHVQILKSKFSRNMVTHNIVSWESWPSSGAKIPERFKSRSWLHQNWQMVSIS